MTLDQSNDGPDLIVWTPCLPRISMQMCRYARWVDALTTCQWSRWTHPINKAIRPQLIGLKKTCTSFCHVLFTTCSTRVVCSSRLGGIGGLVGEAVPRGIHKGHHEADVGGQRKDPKQPSSKEKPLGTTRETVGDHCFCSQNPWGTTVFGLFFPILPIGCLGTGYKWTHSQAPINWYIGRFTAQTLLCFF